MIINIKLAIWALLTSTFCNAQAYHPLLENDKVWLEASFSGQNICLYDKVYEVRIGGDSLIGGQSYRKIIRRNYDAADGTPYCAPFVPQDSEFELTGVYLREDEAEMKVYLRISEIGDDQFEEILLYDFNLQAGDTIAPSSYLTDSQVITVSSVDEVTLANGESRKRISFSNGGEESSYIEGLGGVKGLYQPFFDGIGFWNESKCIRQNEVNLYGDEFACDWTLSAEEPLKGQSRLYPNPAADVFTFELTPQTTFDTGLSFVLHALDGRQVYAASVSSAVSQFQPQVASGMYLWQLRRGGDILNTGKVVME